MSYDHAAVRNFGKVLPLLPFDLLFGWRIKNQAFMRYFDKFAGTTVIDLRIIIPTFQPFFDVKSYLPPLHSLVGGVIMSDKELRVNKIKDGTVIDHIRGGYALDVVNILGITGKEKRVMTIAINVPSKRFGVKDIVKIEGKALNAEEVNRIALVAPRASINFIQRLRSC